MFTVLVVNQPYMQFGRAEETAAAVRDVNSARPFCSHFVKSTAVERARAKSSRLHRRRELTTPRQKLEPTSDANQTPAEFRLRTYPRPKDGTAPDSRAKGQ